MFISKRKDNDKFNLTIQYDPNNTDRKTMKMNFRKQFMLKVKVLCRDCPI